MAEYRSYTEPMEAFENFLEADPRYADALADDPQAVYAVPSVLDAAREFEQHYLGERQTLTMEGMEVPV